MTVADNGAERASDEEFLDRAYERCVDLLEGGSEPTTDDLLEGHEHLRGEVEDLLRIARQATVVRAQGTPNVPGYSVRAEIGRGGMGVVYLARQESLGGRHVALKVLPVQTGASSRTRARFLAEARALASLRHPHVVPLYDVIAEGDVHAYAMEWVDGPSLARLIECMVDRNAHRSDDPPTASLRDLLPQTASGSQTTYTVFVCKLGIAIARALAALHAAGLVHRDVKPSNILLRGDGTPLLADFGLVHELDATLTQSGHFAGTVAYSSPEQLAGARESLNAVSDVYSLGVTLYQALTGHLPFDHAAESGAVSPEEWRRRVERGQARPLRAWNRRLPRDLDTILAKALDPAPEQRYATAEELADDLERLLRLQPIRARHAGWGRRSLKFLRRHRGIAVGTGAGALVALAAAVIAVIGIFFTPQWKRAHVRDARLALLSRAQASSIYVVHFMGVPISESNGAAVPDAMLARAVNSYDAALVWAPTDHALRGERDLVASLRSTNSTRADAIARQDARLAGLRSFLVGDTVGALEAWTKFEEERGWTAEPDPLVAAALGLLYLVDEQPARAYPRLRDAVRLLPDVGFLTGYLAEAAILCGDLAEAKRCLDLAKRQPSPDELGSLERIEMELAIAEGRTADAERLYAGLGWRNGVAAFRYSRWLEQQGRIGEALVTHVDCAHRYPSSTKVRKAVRALSDRWWESLELPERRRRIRGAFDESPAGPESLVALLRARALPTAPGTVDGQPTTGLFFGVFTALVASFSSPPIEAVPLDELARRMEVDNVLFWNQVTHSSSLYKALVATSLRHAALRPLSALLVAHTLYVRVDARQTVRRSAKVAVASLMYLGLIGAPAAPAQVVKDLQFNVDGVLPSSDPEVRYGTAPPAALPESAYFSVSGGILHQRSFGLSGSYPLYGYGYLLHSTTNPPEPVVFADSRALILEFRVKVLHIEGVAGVFGEVYDGDWYAIQLHAGGIRTFHESGAELIPVDVFEFHTYRIETDPGSNTFRIYVDGSLRLCSHAPDLAVYSGFQFGDDVNSAGNSADADWDYFTVSQLPPGVPSLTAVAGVDQSVEEGAVVTLDGSASSIPCGPPGPEWAQVGGPPVTLDVTDPLHPSFVAPLVPAGGATLTFQLIVSGGEVQSAPDTVDVTITNLNSPPVAMAGDDQAVAEVSAVTLDGSHSYDPDTDPLTFTWLQTGGPAVTLGFADPARPTFTAPLVGPAGVNLTFRLEVSDGTDVRADSVTVAVENVNHTPIADAGADQTRAEGALVTLDGQASSDPDADALSFAWMQTGGPAVSLTGAATANPTFTAPLVGAGGAVLVFRVTVDDGLSGLASDDVRVTVLDGNAPPMCNLARPSLDELWPPNHKLIPVAILGVTDPENNAITITITGVTQDEPINGLGDGDTSPDAVIQGSTVLVRAERAGPANGRVYRISFTASDGLGGQCSGQVSVCVPKSQGKNAPQSVDDGQLYDSTGP